MKENNEDDEIVYGHAVAKCIRGILVPPPPGWTSPFKTIHEWLSHVCDGNKPEKRISEFSFWIFGGPDRKVICLGGFNSYFENHTDESRVDFVPANGCFLLPATKYKDLLPNQVQAEVQAEILKFTETDKFKESFLAQGDSITIDDNEPIWPNV